MVDADIVALKLLEVADRVARVRQHLPAEAGSLAEDRDTLDLVSFNLLLAVQACLDLASHLISDEGWGPAASLAAAFERLAEHGVLRPETAASLAQAAALRNLIAHGYIEIDPLRLHGSTLEGLPDFDRFLAEVSAWMERRGAGT
jgi:uncharacterized protein YutE (UPF0331/DUF86 family)